MVYIITYCVSVFTLEPVVSLTDIDCLCVCYKFIFDNYFTIVASLNFQSICVRSIFYIVIVVYYL